MRPRLPVLVAVTSLLTVLSPASPGPTPAAHAQPIGITEASRTPLADLAFVERMLYSVSLADFVRTADQRAAWDERFDWSTDGCSAPLVGSTGRSFDFQRACRRHDFGYRNLQRLEARSGTGGTYWNGDSRARVDRRFRSDMQAHCATRSWHERYTCLAWADTFYGAVRAAGGG